MSWQNIFIADVCHSLSKMWQPGRCSWQEKQPLDCTNSSFTLGIHAEFESMINCRWVCIVYHLIVPSCDLALIVLWFSFHECCFQVPQTIDICLLHVIYVSGDCVPHFCCGIVHINQAYDAMVVYVSAFASCCYQLRSYVVYFVLWRAFSGKTTCVCSYFTTAFSALIISALCTKSQILTMERIEY
jgi:hypothetical protein